MLRARIVVLASWTLAACGAGTATQATPPTAPSVSAAAPTTTAATPEQPAAGLKAPGEASVGDRSTCLVSKEEFTVTAASPKVEHQGKTYYFCCSGCDTKFTKDPAKYLGK